MPLLYHYPRLGNPIVALPKVGYPYCNTTQCRAPLLLQTPRFPWFTRLLRNPRFPRFPGLLRNSRFPRFTQLLRNPWFPGSTGCFGTRGSPGSLGCFGTHGSLGSAVALEPTVTQFPVSSKPTIPLVSLEPTVSLVASESAYSTIPPVEFGTHSSSVPPVASGFPVPCGTSRIRGMCSRSLL